MLMEHSRRIAVSVLIALILPVATSHAQERYQERYAVLVGVGEYTYLENDLKGPANDVQLARNYLLSEGFDANNIHWLADDAPITPERDNILKALEAVDARVQAGDFVLLHFSGHGSRICGSRICAVTRSETEHEMIARTAIDTHRLHGCERRHIVELPAVVDSSRCPSLPLIQRAFRAAGTAMQRIRPTEKKLSALRQIQRYSIGAHGFIVHSKARFSFGHRCRVP